MLDLDQIPASNAPPPRAAPRARTATLLDQSESPTRAQILELANELSAEPSTRKAGESLGRFARGELFAKHGERNGLAWQLMGDVVEAFPKLDPYEMTELFKPGIQAAIDDGSEQISNDSIRSMLERQQADKQVSATMKLRAVASLKDYGNWLQTQHPVAANAMVEQEDPYRWPVLDVTQIFAPVPPTEYLIPALDIAPGAPALFAGYGFSGKTVAEQSKNLSLATGRPVWGKLPCRQGRVLHIDYEQGASLTRRRYQRLAAGVGIDFRELGGRLDLVSMPRLYLDPAKDEDEMIRRCMGYDAISLDSLLASCPGLEENDSGARRFLDMWLRVSERTGACVTVIRHARKPSQAPGGGGVKMALRGSSALFDAAASVLMLEAEQGEPVKVTHTKARHSGRPCEPFVLLIEDVAVGGVPDGGLRVVMQGAEDHEQRRDEAKLLKACESIRKALQGARVPPSSKEGLRALAGIGKGPFDHAYAAMRARGEIYEGGSVRDRRIELREVAAPFAPGVIS